MPAWAITLLVQFGGLFLKWGLNALKPKVAETSTKADDVIVEVLDQILDHKVADPSTAIDEATKALVKEKLTK